MTPSSQRLRASSNPGAIQPRIQEAVNSKRKVFSLSLRSGGFRKFHQSGAYGTPVDFGIEIEIEIEGRVRLLQTWRE
jgi:hypothetical protein